MLYSRVALRYSSSSSIPTNSPLMSPAGARPDAIQRKYLCSAGARTGTRSRWFDAASPTWRAAVGLWRAACVAGGGKLSRTMQQLPLGGGGGEGGGRVRAAPVRTPDAPEQQARYQSAVRASSRARSRTRACVHTRVAKLHRPVRASLSREPPSRSRAPRARGLDRP
jgi:hypothetical protein